MRGERFISQFTFITHNSESCETLHFAFHRRYIEALHHIVKKKARLSGSTGAVTVNVCETGFNGGHSAMLFLAFLDEGNVNVNYWGWDLKQVCKSKHTTG